MKLKFSCIMSMGILFLSGFASAAPPTAEEAYRSLVDFVAFSGDNEEKSYVGKLSNGESCDVFLKKFMFGTELSRTSYVSTAVRYYTASRELTMPRFELHETNENSEVLKLETSERQYKLVYRYRTFTDDLRALFKHHEAHLTVERNESKEVSAVKVIVKSGPIHGIYPARVGTTCSSLKLMQ